MNRRSFIKSCVITGIAIPTIGFSFENHEHKTYPINDFVEILSLNQLKEHGIRCAPYCASCVDNNGMFPHEGGYNSTISEPFIKKAFVLNSLPRIHSDVKAVKLTLGKMRSGVKLDGKEWSVEKVITEIKEKMEYVCYVCYGKVPCSCGDFLYVPFVGGLNKQRYQLYLEQMNKNECFCKNDRW